MTVPLLISKGTPLDPHNNFSKFAPNYTILSTMMQYVDVNECLDNNGGCSDNCTNTNGSYYCSCFSGFELLSDNHNCEGNKMIYNSIMHA